MFGSLTIEMLCETVIIISIYQGGAVTNITIGGAANGGAGGDNQVHFIFLFRHKV